MRELTFLNEDGFLMVCSTAPCGMVGSGDG